MITGYYKERLQVQSSKGKGRQGQVQETSQKPPGVPSCAVTGTALSAPAGTWDSAVQHGPLGVHWGSVTQAWSPFSNPSAIKLYTAWPRAQAEKNSHSLL